MERPNNAGFATLSFIAIAVVLCASISVTEGKKSSHTRETKKGRSLHSVRISRGN